VSQGSLQEGKKKGKGESLYRLTNDSQSSPCSSSSFLGGGKEKEKQPTPLLIPRPIQGKSGSDVREVRFLAFIPCRGGEEGKGKGKE